VCRMPEGGVTCLSKPQLLSHEEIVQLAWVG